MVIGDCVFVKPTCKVLRPTGVLGKVIRPPTAEGLVCVGDFSRPVEVFSKTNHSLTGWELVPYSADVLLREEDLEVLDGIGTCVPYVSLEIQLHGLKLEKNDDVERLLSEIHSALHEMLDKGNWRGRGFYFESDVEVSLSEYAGNTIDDIETRDFK